MPAQLIKLEREREREREKTESRVTKAAGQIQTSNHSGSPSITLSQDAEYNLIWELRERGSEEVSTEAQHGSRWPPRPQPSGEETSNPPPVCPLSFTHDS